jgi:hypothetical protein
MANNLTDVPDHARCTARARRSGQRCRRAAIAGGRVCPTHGGSAPAVKARAAERRALAQALALTGVEGEADPREALLLAVKCTAALLAGYRDALQADDADAGDLSQLTSAALVTARVSKLALDARVEERLTTQHVRMGEMVGGIITRVVQGLGLDAETSAQAFSLVRAEVEYGHLDLGELDAEIRRVTEELREHTLRDAEKGFPERLGRAVEAGLAVLDLTDDDQERAVQAIEGFLVLEREELARQEEAVKPAPPEPVRPWWADSPRYRAERRNGSRR